MRQGEVVGQVMLQLIGRSDFLEVSERGFIVALQYVDQSCIVSRMVEVWR